MMRLRETSPVTPAVTPETRAVTRVTRLRHVSKCSHAQARASVASVYFSREQHKTMCNRVTHVTTGISGVTARVTNIFPRNHKEGETVKEERNEKAVWVRNNLPTCAAVADAFRDAFPGVRLVYACENGHTLGQRGPDGVKMSETGVGPMAISRKAAK